MDVDIITSTGMARVATIHRGDADDSPVQMISARQLAHYQAIEAVHQDLLQKLAALLPGAPMA
jgi:hypothetical protein